MTATLSVEAVHDKVKPVDVIALDAKPAGTLGATVSGAAEVVTLKAELWDDQFGMASRALTVIL